MSGAMATGAEDVEQKLTRHPLLSPSVIRSILFCLPIKDVTICEQVCQVWSEEARSVLEEKATETFLDDEELANHLRQNVKKTKYELYDGVSFSQSNSTLCQFLSERGAHVRTLILQHTTPPVLDQDLFWALGTHLPRLEALTLCSLPATEGAPPPHHHAGRDPTFSFPSVKRLVVGTMSFGATATAPPAAVNQLVGVGQAPVGGGDPRSRVRQVLVSLLSCLPNLEDISLSLLDERSNTRATATNANRAANEIIAALAHIPPPVEGTGAIGLNFQLQIDQAFQQHEERAALGALSSRRISTINLHLEEVPALVPVAQLLLALAPTLSSLQLTFGPDVSGLEGITPAHNWLQLPQLKHLTLAGYRWSPDFLTYLTKLETLECNSAPVPFASIFPAAPVSAPDLHTLKIHGPSTGITVGAELVRNIGRAFPRLRVLHLPDMGDDGLRAIYLHIPHLIELVCTEGTVTDCGVTGIPRHVCLDMQDEISALRIIAADGVDNGAKFRSDLFIGNLESLCHLRLESPAITSLSILFGVVACGGLRSVQLASGKIDDFGVEVMAKQIGHGWTPKCINLVHCPSVTRKAKAHVLEEAHAHNVSALEMWVPGDGAAASRGSEEAQWRQAKALHRERGRKSRGRLKRANELASDSDT